MENATSSGNGGGMVEGQDRLEIEAQSDSALATIPSGDAVARDVEAAREALGADEEEEAGKRKEINNMAGDAVLCENVRKWAHTQVELFRQQPQREEYTKSGGVMDVADRMWRCSLRRKEDSDQHQDTLSNVSSTAYYRAVNAVSGAETMIFFADPFEMPALYEPEINTREYPPDIGETIAKMENLREQYVFDEDKRREKIRHALWQNNKYGNALLGIEWDERACEVEDRVPVEFDAQTGAPTRYEWKSVVRRLSSWPTLCVYDMKDCFFDAQIDKEEDWRCLAIRTMVPFERLLEAQRAGQIANVDKIRPRHFYTGDTEDETVMDDRLANSGVQHRTEANGLVEVWHVWGMMPVKQHKRRGRGKWDVKEIPALHWATFAGSISTAGALPLRMIRNPHGNGKMPYKLLHSHRDDCGAFHQGFAQKVESLYWQATTNINQAFDNVTLATQAPWMVDGPILSGTPGRFRANKIVKLGRGVTFKQVDTRDTTGITMGMNDRVERDIEKTTDADKPVQGEAFGPRVSATDSNNAFEQSMLALDNKAAYVADQLFPWMLEWDSHLMRRYCDPEVTLRVTKGNEIVEVNPANLYGPIRTKVVAITRFKNSVQKRRELNSFMQGPLSLALQYMDQEGAKQFFIDAFREFGFEKAEMYFPVNGGYDSEMRAIQAVHMMAMMGQWVEPRPEENHKAWLRVMEQAAAEYALLPRNEMDPERLRMLQAHIEIRKGMVKAQEQQQKQLQAGMGGGDPNAMAGGAGDAVAALPGQVTGDMMEAEAGAAAQ